MPAPNTETTDTISGHLSRLGHEGMGIYFGTRWKNYAATDEYAFPYCARRVLMFF